MLKNSVEHYGLVARILHWLGALVVPGLFAVGLWMVNLTYYSQWYNTAPDIHRSIGILFTFTVFFRFLWRLGNVQPAALSTHTSLEVKLGHIVHGLIYVLLLVMFISGYLISTAEGDAVAVFDWFQIPALITNEQLGINALQDTAGGIHEYSAYCLIGLVIVHALAALKHHFIDRDSTLLRMLGKP